VTPYASLSYFLLLLYPLGALTALGVVGRLGRAAVLVTSVALVAFQYGHAPEGADVAGAPRQLVFLAAYAATSLAAAVGYAGALRRGRSRVAFAGALVLVLAPLVAVKVHPLLASRAARPVPGPPGAPVAIAGLFDEFGFVGMSYMALRAVDVLIALRDGVTPATVRVGELASYLVFVPTISAGPIDRFARFAGDLHRLPRARRDYVAEIETGLHRIAQGMLYKFIVAALLHRHVLRPLADRHGALATVAYMYAYSGYLFFDFAGYSAFAIGVGHFFGVHVPENFDAPFRSRNFREMWNRWHITLSWWLRDHVYMRFVLHAARRRWFRGNRQLAHVCGLMLTMGLMGCWHGLEPRYVVYGVYQGAMLVTYDLVGRWRRRPARVGGGRLAHAASVLVTVNLFCFGLLIFSGRLFR
jgi:membrane protein involved in D-alanine export